MKILLHGMSEIFLPMFSSRTLMVLQVIFKSFIHLEFIVVYGISWWWSLIFFNIAVQIYLNNLFEEATWTPFYASAPFNEY